MITQHETLCKGT